MSDESQEQSQEQPQEQLQENTQTLKNEIKNELKEEFNNFRQKRKHRVIYSLCIFALGLVIGFGGGMATHSEHQFAHGYGHDHGQKWDNHRK